MAALGYECPLCRRAFKSFAALRFHFQRIHPVDGTKECPVCSKKTKNAKMHVYNRARLGDAAHKAVYGLLPRGGAYAAEFKRECREFAIKALSVGVERW